MATVSRQRKMLNVLKEKLEQGMLPQFVVTDPDIYDMELSGIFAKTWQFLAHESEIPEEPGSYLTRWIVNDPVLLVRNQNGEIKAFLNSCTHRGSILCAADHGKKRGFTCPYHGWTFNLDGELIGIVAGDKIYGEKMVRSEWNLRPIPRVESYRGMIFANLDPNAMSLEDYLGDMKWYLDIFFTRSDNGMEVIGAPHRWVAKANWKMTAENFNADPYHVQYTHRSTVEMGISPSDPLYASYGHQVVIPNGHGINVVTGKDGRSRYTYQTLPESMWPMFKRNLQPAQDDILSRATVFVGGIFPNLSFVSPVHGTEGHLHNYLNFRLWRPLGPEKIEVWSWFFIDKDCPEEYKQESYKGYLGSFGTSGTLEQDDTEIWAQMVEANRGFMTRDKDLNYNNLINYLMGYDLIKPDPTFPGPGTAYPSTYNDSLARNIHEAWLKLMLAELERREAEGE